MRWFEQFLSEDEIVVRDKFNRRRLISQRKWVVAICSVGLLFDSEKISLLETYGPFNLELLTDDNIALACFAGTSFITLYCLLQLPTFLLNYNDYIRESFSRLRTAEISDEAATVTELRDERQRVRNEIETVEARLGKLSELAPLQRETVGDVRGSLSRQSVLEKTAELLDTAITSDLSEKLSREIASDNDQLSALMDSYIGVEKQLEEALSKLGETSIYRQRKLVMFRLTEVATDLTRIIPTLAFGGLGIKNFFGW